MFASVREPDSWAIHAHDNSCRDFANVAAIQKNPAARASQNRHHFAIM
jgi:hypothetical protein